MVKTSGRLQKGIWRSGIPQQIEATMYTKSMGCTCQHREADKLRGVGGHIDPEQQEYYTSCIH